MADLVRVRHPRTGQVSRIGATQFERHLAPLGFTLVGQEAEAAPDTPETPGASPEDAGAATGGAGGNEGAPPPPGDTDPLAEAVGDAKVADALRAADLGTPEALGAASDDQLRAVDGVGPGRLKRLREYAANAATTEETDQ